MTTAPGEHLKRIKLRYAGTCRTCAAPLPAGTLAGYDRLSRVVHCLECLPSVPTRAGMLSNPPWQLL